MSPSSPLLHVLPLHCCCCCCCCWVLLTFFLTQAHALQCYACNIQGQRHVDVGCSSPGVITCSHFYKGFKQRFCIRTESIALGMVLTSGCATSRHCHTEELPGVKIHCCDSDLCNCASRYHKSSLSSYTLYLMMLSLTVLWLQH